MHHLPKVYHIIDALVSFEGETIHIEEKTLLSNLEA